MLKQLLIVWGLSISILAIKVPVEDKGENATEVVPTKQAEKKQDKYYVTDSGEVDSYLIPPNPHEPLEVLPENIVTPATYLLPPALNRQIEYYAPTEAGEQTDWYPITQAPLPPSLPINLLPLRLEDEIPIALPNNQSFELVQTTRGGKAYDGQRFAFPIPATELLPPHIEAPNEYKILVPSQELELPHEEINHQFQVQPQSEYYEPIIEPKRKFPKNKLRVKPVEPTLALHLTPPKPYVEKLKNPTKLYPKKVVKVFRPIPIPIGQFVDDSLEEVPRAKPVQPVTPASNEETDYYTPSDEKRVYQYEQAELKRKLKAEQEAEKQQQLAAAADIYDDIAPTEQETSETNYRPPGRNAYPVPLRQEPPTPQSNVPAPPPNGERTEFRMHGMKGPHSYQFGFDTGKGKNRQFRFEERDNDGRVKGHYGYMDRSGKMRVVNYGADPEHGFHADSPVEAE